MHIVITDSGVGGLSVVAYAERFIRTQGFREPLRLTFANAAPANDYGYNSMPTRDAKLETFDRFLRNVTERFAPDCIYVACNTLSVFLPEVHATVPIQGIIETGVDVLLDALDSRSVAMIFGTQTTIDSGAYPRELMARGVDPSRIVTQACPGLADVISEDRDGTKSRAEIQRWVDTAIAKMSDRDAPICHPERERRVRAGERRNGRPAPPSSLAHARDDTIVACLACTHYGYRKEMFADALNGATVINPNESAVDDLFASTGSVHDVEVEFVTRYAIPQTTIDTLTWLLSDVSPRTVAAMREFIHVPDLF